MFNHIILITFYLNFVYCKTETVVYYFYGNVDFPLEYSYMQNNSFDFLVTGLILPDLGIKNDLHLPFDTFKHQRSKIWKRVYNIGSRLEDKDLNDYSLYKLHSERGYLLKQFEFSLKWYIENIPDEDLVIFTCDNGCIITVTISDEYLGCSNKENFYCL